MMDQEYIALIQELQIYQQELESQNEELRQTEDALTKTHQKYLELYDFAPVGYVTLNRQGQIEAINLAGAAMLGLSRRYLRGKPFTAYLASNSISPFLKHVDLVYETHREQICELCLESANSDNGEVTYIQMNSSPILDSQTERCTGLRTVLTDITRLKKTETTLRVKDLAIASSVSAIAMADLSGDLTYVNPSFLNMWGYQTEQEVLGRSVLTFWEKPSAAQQIVQALQTEGHCFGELVGLRANGSRFDVQLIANIITDDQKQPIFMMASFLDVTAQKQAERNLKQYEQIVATLPDLIALIGRDYRYLVVNDAYCTAYNKKRTEIVGHTIAEVISQKRFTELKARIDRCLTGKKLTYEEWFTYPKLGSRYRRVQYMPSYNHKGEIIAIAATIHDLTDLKMAQQASYFLASIVESSEDAIIGNAIDGTIISWNEAATRIYGYQPEETIGYHISKILPPHRTEQELKQFERVKHGEHVSRYETQRLHQDGRLIDVSLTISPIFNEEKMVIGLASIAHDITRRKRDQANLNLATQHLQQAYDETLIGWASALELRDAETGGHSQRVVTLTMQLADKLNFPESGREHLRRGALLHDIGKMGIPDDILQKPGPLTKSEREKMKQHPLYAYHMLKSIDYLKPALDVAHYHHERWDGKGYPYGLKGTQIPLMARIFSIVDVWDAITSDRPYRLAWSTKQALAYIEQNIGKSFDPQVGRAFLELIQQKISSEE